MCSLAVNAYNCDKKPHHLAMHRLLAWTFLCTPVLCTSRWSPNWHCEHEDDIHGNNELVICGCGKVQVWTASRQHPRESAGAETTNVFVCKIALKTKECAFMFFGFGARLKYGWASRCDFSIYGVGRSRSHGLVCSNGSACGVVGLVGHFFDADARLGGGRDQRANARPGPQRLIVTIVVATC